MLTLKSVHAFVFHRSHDGCVLEYCPISLNTFDFVKSLPSRSVNTFWSMPKSPTNEFGLLITVISTSWPGVVCCVDNSIVTKFCKSFPKSISRWSETSSSFRMVYTMTCALGTIANVAKKENVCDGWFGTSSVRLKMTSPRPSTWYVK